MKTHKGEKSHKCDQCDYACYQSGNLKKHMKTHNGEKSHKCARCDFACNQAGWGKGTVAKYLEKHGLFQECISWLQRYYPTETFSILIPGRPQKNRTHIDALQHMVRKLGMGLGYWDKSSWARRSLLWSARTSPSLSTPPRTGFSTSGSFCTWWGCPRLWAEGSQEKHQLHLPGFHF